VGGAIAQTDRIEMTTIIIILVWIATIIMAYTLGARHMGRLIANILPPEYIDQLNKILLKF
jgi:hypothetical protein